MGLRLRRTIWTHIYRLPDAAAHSESVVPLVCRSDQGRTGSPAVTDESKHDRVGNVVLADVGGTNVRFALLTGGGLGPIEHMAVRDHQRFGDALAAFLARQTQRAAIRSAIFAVAGVVTCERCALTNNAWVIDAAQLRARFGLTGIS